MTHHIIHDLDRDGWGSAALVVAELGDKGIRVVGYREVDGGGLRFRVGAVP